MAAFREAVTRASFAEFSEKELRAGGVANPFAAEWALSPSFFWTERRAQTTRLANAADGRLSHLYPHA